MRLFILLFVFCAPLVAQQLVIPEELTPSQKRVYRKITEAVSAPCCSNAIPIAYHESGMALQVKDYVLHALLKGEGEKTIMEDLAKMKLGPDNRPLIFAVPDKNILGWLIWFTPLIATLLGLMCIYLFRGSSQKRPQMSNEDLIETYRSYIKARLDSGKA